ncbi:MAG: 50S ribosomal protein L23 [Pirellulales bacterium]
MSEETTIVDTGYLPAHQVLISPLITEKGTQQTEIHNVYAFEINLQATKFDVRRAVEEMFHVKVERVAIQNRKGKFRRSRFKTGKTADWKKAVVKLAGDDKIELF